jgi:hypothetical protein
MTRGICGMTTSCRSKYAKPTMRTYPTSAIDAVMGDFLHIRAKKWLDKMEDASATETD